MPWPDRGRKLTAAAQRRGGTDDFGLLDAKCEALETPIRATLFGAARFEQHGRSLARTHAVVPGGRGGVFFPRLSQNVAVLQRSREFLESRARQGRHLGPAAHWLLDNAALLDEQLLAVRRGLPRSFFQLLPLLRDEPLAGLPRIYSVAWAWVAHTDSGFDAGLLEAYLRAYQEVQPLTLAELWALHTTLRVVLVENLRRLAERAAAQQAARDAAHHWLDHAGADPQHLAVRERARQLATRGVSEPFLLTLVQRREDLGAPSARLLDAWLQMQLPDVGAALTRQHNEAAEDQQSIRNAITTLRELERVDWRAIVARSSAAVRLLDRLPVHAAESEATQDATLHEVERLARRSGRSELAVTEVLMTLTAQAADVDDARAACAYWWCGDGEDTLHALLGLEPQRWPRRGTAAMRKAATAPYLLGVTLLSIGLVAWLLRRYVAADVGAAWLTVTALLMLGPVSEAVVAVVNRLISESLRPAILPRLAFASGVPEVHRSLVVIPALIDGAQTVSTLARQLELHHLANPEPHAQFALLSDFVDADIAHIDADVAVLAAARQAITELNARYPPSSAARPPRFLLLHRERRWSESEQRWIGWERKRGKLEQLVRALVTPEFRPFIELGALSRYAASTRYLITLDADTGLPPGRLRELVGIAAHPLNQPRIDPLRHVVIAGYGILQPRVVTPLPLPERVTWYHRLFSGQCGTDAYSLATSEIYQDLFGEGSFTGKGLMNVAAVHATLVGRLPAEQVLSHDLLEGSIARCAGVSDVTIVEEAPMHSDVAASRLHRWTRGDWQLLPFLIGPQRVPLALIQRWKMADNLRRSLVAPAACGLLLVSAACEVVPLGLASLLVAAAFSAGPLLGAVAALAPSRDDIALRPFYRQGLIDLARAAMAAVWHGAQLLQLALLYLDAIARACWRQAVSRRHLLQWTTAAAAQSQARSDLPALARQHWRTPLVAVLIAAIASGAEQLGMDINWQQLAPLLLLWSATAGWTWLASRERPSPQHAPLNRVDRAYLRALARETWRYYERHVGVTDHHLPPDNVQFSPHMMVAHRTSPTNIGLYLLAAACAREMGFIGTAGFAERVAATLDTLEQLPRHGGHFYNWYDTQSLAVLAPPYVSTVDSGNCAAHLLVLAQACAAAATEEPRHAMPRRLAQALQRSPGLVDALGAMASLQGIAALLKERTPWPRDAASAEALRERWRVAARELPALDIAQDGTQDGAQGGAHDDSLLCKLHDLMTTVDSLLRDAVEDMPALRHRLIALAERARAIALQGDFGLLYDRRRRLLHIGLRVDTQHLDNSHYDLLASESRLTSLLAIAKGDLPAEHWGALGRPFFAEGANIGLRSWSGSMFEYLMPSLVLDEPTGSVLQQAARSAVAMQEAEAEGRGTPWGISESAIAAQDHTLAYQYGPQGAPRLALRRTPQDERVIAPYASALALLVAPDAAVDNLRALQALGARRALGFIEAIDYTPQRQAAGQSPTFVHTYMAHHQGMSLVAMCNVLNNSAARRWSQGDAHLSAVQALLHERAPREVPALRSAAPTPLPRHAAGAHLARDVVPLHEPLPLTQLLGNGRYAVMLRSQGSGWSRWHEHGLTRWRDDLLRDAHGHFIYVQRSGETGRHSITAHPAPDARARYRCRMQPDRVIFDARWSDLRARSTVWVSAEDDCELRRVELTNTGSVALDLTLSSAIEPTLATPRADEAHPAFSSLFVQAHWDGADRALYLHRKPRLAGEAELHAVHCLALADDAVLTASACTDRLRWFGRYGDATRPAGDAGAAAVGDGDGAHGKRAQGTPPGKALDTGLDPMSVINARVHLEPGASTTLTFVCAAATDLGVLDALVDKYRHASHVERASSMSHTMISIQLRELQFDADAWTALLTLNTLLSASATRERRLDATAGVAPSCDRRALWRHGMGGERPMLCVGVRSEEGLGLVQALVRALPVWTLAGVGVDLVVINGEPMSYLAPVQQQLALLVDRARTQIDERVPAAQRATLRLLRELDLGAKERITLQTLARAYLQADGRTLAEHVARIVDEHRREFEQRRRHNLQPVQPVLQAQPASGAMPEPPRGHFDDVDGGFRFELQTRSYPARPWINVLANPDFGCHVSEVGAGHTWARNSRMHQITRWSNDAVSDPPGEWLLLQDRDTSRVWPLGRALIDGAPRLVEHGIGFTRMRQRIEGLDITLTWCVDEALAIKQLQLSIRAVEPDRARKLRVVALSEWLLGSSAEDRLSLATSSMRLPSAREAAPEGATLELSALACTQLEEMNGFDQTTAFLAWRVRRSAIHGGADIDNAHDWTCDRREFHDASGRMVLPARLGQRCGVGLDACAATGLSLNLAPRGAVELTLLMGHAKGLDAAQTLLAQAWPVEPAERLRRQRAQWDELVGAVQVRSPDPLFDALVNHWLPYQTVACRLWARAGFYQAGGAFGYRDQLQDATAMVTRAPHLLATQIRRNASRQFAEGDVQHWWHEPGGAGVRTHSSDDRLWLPSALALYVERTGDRALLDETVPFLDGAPVPAAAEDIYETPRISANVASIYEHAARAIDCSLRVGAHGLPLIGTGDWNDGMNRVGHLGRGESVWLAWFSCQVVDDMLPIAQARRDNSRVQAWRSARAGWVTALDSAGWDGQWYRRGYFDDGTPLGSAQNSECRIDLIAQAWAVLTGAGQSARAAAAFDSAKQELWDEPAQLMRLLHPPLQRAQPNAGYIQAYPPGVRENGGQYNHGAVWALMAAAKLQQRDWVWRIFNALSPAHRWASGDADYAVEPYVMAGDISSHAPWTGRGGWSWYTGAAGWMLSAAIESICGVVVARDSVTVTPCLPPGWGEVTVRLRRSDVVWLFVVCSDSATLDKARARHPRVRVLARGETVQLAPADAGLVHLVDASRSVAVAPVSAVRG